MLTVLEVSIHGEVCSISLLLFGKEDIIESLTNSYISHQHFQESSFF